MQDRYADGVFEFAQPLQTEELPEVHVHDRRWDLGTVLELLKLYAVRLAEDDKSGEGLADPREACEEAIRNYDRALSLALAHLIGHARQDLAMERL